MPIPLLLLIIFSVSLSAVAQVMLKHGMSSNSTQTALQNKVFLDLVSNLATNGYVISGLTLYVLSMAAWLMVLGRVDVTVAYPFVGLGFILTMIMGAWLLSEPVTSIRIVGTFLIVVGVTLVSRTA